MVIATVMCYNNPDFKSSEITGFTGMLLAFSFIFLGIRNFREKRSNGIITFGKALRIGLLIALIASTCYVVAWLIEYYFFLPDFMEKYSAFQLKEAKTSGLNAAAIQEKAQEMAKYKAWYKNPLLIILLTFMEILPFGVVVALISALILKKKV
ncbi:MAG: DUF4199 domain-containing protein [Cyanobacteria bacterium]|nr:DUF4199 domain-containing protein [Cyanobacteriota bacterium]